jgi:lipopolysaccharide transport system permease protein
MTQKHSPSTNAGTAVTVIEPKPGWHFVDFKELKDYRDLFFFMVWRDIKVLYAQTILGLFWAILQPMMQILIYTIVFGKVAKVNTDGIPYFLFCSVAIIPWTYISTAMNQSSQSLVSGHHMLEKIYFPRLIYPITPVMARMVDFFISILILVGVFFWYGVQPTWQILYFPLFCLMMMGFVTAVGMWLSAMAIRFRDVKQAMPFVVHMLIYTAPIVYSSSGIPEKYRLLYSLNPLVGLIEGFRACLLGLAMPWSFIWPSAMIILLLMAGGALYFRTMERFFVDVI